MDATSFVGRRCERVFLGIDRGRLIRCLDSNPLALAPDEPCDDVVPLVHKVSCVCYPLVVGHVCPSWVARCCPVVLPSPDPAPDVEPELCKKHLEVARLDLGPLAGLSVDFVPCPFGARLVERLREEFVSHEGVEVVSVPIVDRLEVVGAVFLHEHLADVFDGLLLADACRHDVCVSVCEGLSAAVCLFVLLSSRDSRTPRRRPIGLFVFVVFQIILFFCFSIL